MNTTSEFQPLFPDASAVAPLLQQAAALIAEGHRLESAAGALAPALKPLLRSMNSYYTNKIEGQHTRPTDIERALARQFDADQVQARKQRLAVAHIDTETELEAALPPRAADLYEPAFVQRIHRGLYDKLPPQDRITGEGTPLVPGGWRRTRVTAGRHLAPDAASIPGLLAAWQKSYAELPGVEHAVVGAACSHHRLLWVHPFPDGNGRTARLHTHLVLTAHGLTQGLWSPLRGMAREHEAYYARLNNADLPRRNDIDGRGNLSQEELVAFTAWLLELCLDQARFMRSLLAFDQLKSRLLDLLIWLAARPWAIGSEKAVIKTDALEALHYVATAGSLDRTRFMAMTGLPHRTARRVLSSLLHFGLLVSEGPKGPVSFGVPVRSLRFLFPQLWPEAEVERP